MGMRAVETVKKSVLPVGASGSDDRNRRQRRARFERLNESFALLRRPWKPPNVFQFGEINLD